jgi:hypothetical protein
MGGAGGTGAGLGLASGTSPRGSDGGLGEDEGGTEGGESGVSGEGGGRQEMKQVISKEMKAAAKSKRILRMYQVLYIHTCTIHSCTIHSCTIHHTPCTILRMYQRVFRAFEAQLQQPTMQLAGDYTSSNTSSTATTYSTYLMIKQQDAFMSEVAATQRRARSSKGRKDQKEVLYSTHCTHYAHTQRSEGGRLYTIHSYTIHSYTMHHTPCTMHHALG